MTNKFSKKSDKKANYNERNDKRKTIYVYPGKYVIAKALNDPVKSKYSYGVAIKPLDGSYYDSKNRKWYYARELANYQVILNLKEDDAKDVKKGKILVKGIDTDNFVFIGDEYGEETE